MGNTRNRGRQKRAMGTQRQECELQCVSWSFKKGVRMKKVWMVLKIPRESWVWVVRPVKGCEGQTSPITVVLFTMLTSFHCAKTSVLIGKRLEYPFFA